MFTLQFLIIVSFTIFFSYFVSLLHVTHRYHKLVRAENTPAGRDLIALKARYLFKNAMCEKKN